MPMTVTVQAMKIFTIYLGPSHFIFTI